MAKKKKKVFTLSVLKLQDYPKHNNSNLPKETKKIVRRKSCEGDCCGG